MTNDEIITWDDVRDMLTRVKSGVSSCDFPLFLNKTIDVAGYYSMCSYDTLPYVNPSGLSPYYVVNGKATFSNMNDTDKEFVGMLAQWYREGLLDPGFASYNSHTDYEDKLTSNMVGMTLLSPGEIVGLANKTNDPDCEWVPIHKPLKTPDQTLHIGCELTRVFYGSSP
jgi:ABC-type glycerol-3-phosphate transport system substrate-binding protein